MLDNTFDGDQQVPPHVHEVEEVLVVIAGTCTFQIGDDSVIAGQGDAVIVPPHTQHGIGHTGQAHATVLAGLASPDVETPRFPG